MSLKPLKTEEDYRKALAEIENLFDAEPDTPECDRLDILTTLVEAYEKIHYPIDLPDPLEAILYYFNSRGLSIDALQFEDNQVEYNRFVDRTAQNPVTITLDPDVAAVFTTSEAVNHTLRSLLSASKMS